MKTVAFTASEPPDLAVGYRAVSHLSIGSAATSPTASYTPTTLEIAGQCSLQESYVAPDHRLQLTPGLNKA